MMLKDFDKIFYLFTPLIIFSIFTGFLFIVGGNVLALSSNYGKINNDALSVAEWNELANDFLANSGGTDGTMSGDLSMGGRKMSNVGSISSDSDVINKKYIDNYTISASGGTTFTNWGRSDCPTGTSALYNGFGFGNTYNDIGGSTENLCIESSSSFLAFTGTLSWNLYPMTTAPWAFYLPTNFAPVKTFIRCAVCYKGGSSCYVKSGGKSCDGAYNIAYSGYLLGALSGEIYSHYSSKERICVNEDFDDTTVSGTSPGTAAPNNMALMYGTRIKDNVGASDFSENTFIDCVVCCN